MHGKYTHITCFQKLNTEIWTNCVLYFFFLGGGVISACQISGKYTLCHVIELFSLKFDIRLNFYSPLPSTLKLIFKICLSSDTCFMHNLSDITHRVTNNANKIIVIEIIWKSYSMPKNCLTFLFVSDNGRPIPALWLLGIVVRRMTTTGLFYCTPCS